MPSTKKTVLITGASRGIGAAAARLFSQAGYAVGVHYHQREDLALALVAELNAAGEQAIPLQADLSQPQSAMELVDKMFDNFGHVDILLSNAGVSWTGTLPQMDIPTWNHLRSTNLDATLHLCQAVYPHMVHQKWGRILTVSSMWGRVGASCEVGYSATKAGIIGLTKALAQELAPSGITVNCVAPGVIDTDMNANLSPADLAALAEETPVGRLGTPDDVAHALLFLASDQASFITGQILGVDGGFISG